jgi:alpha-tubulin suppressor-like RCC1 family protein
MKKTKLFLALTLLFTISINAQCWQSFAEGSGNSLAIKGDGTLWAWGANFYGEVGNGTTTTQLTPIQIGTANNWKMVSSGGNHSMAIKTDGTLWTWGYNGNGQLGNGTITNTNVPTQIGVATNWNFVNLGNAHSIAIKTDGTLWTWGLNSNGQLGNSTTTDVYTPTQIGVATNWQSAAGGENATMAIQSNGTLWGCGANSFGQLGDGTSTQRTALVQIGAATIWSAIALGQAHTLAIKTNGTLWTWGINFEGQLGDGTNTAKSAPVQVGIATNWKAVGAAYRHSVATKTDGTFWAWGYNANYQLGNGTTTNTNVPTQVGTATNWASPDAGSFTSSALKTDGTIWGCGYNNSGQIGDGTNVTKTTVVIVTTTCINGAALDFDGVNDYVSVTSPTNIPIGNSLYTIEAKIKPRTLGIEGIAGWGTYGIGNQVNALRLDGSGNIINYWWGPDLTVSSSPVNMLDGNWHHIAATFDGTTRKIYLDGVLKGSDIPGGHTVPNGANFRIGSTNNGEFFNGGLDEVRIWNTARTTCEINSYMNCEIPTSAAGLIANYHFNQGIAASNNATETSLTDVSGNSNTGTLTNFLLSGSTSNWVAPGAVVSGYTTALASPTIAVNSGSIIGGSSFTMTPSGGISYTYSPSGPIVTPSTSATYTVTGTNSVSCTNSAVSTVSVQGAGLNFDGADDYVINTSPTIPGMTAFTFETWVNCSNGSNAKLFSSNEMEVAIAGNFINFYCPAFNSSSTSTITLGVWTHIAITYNGTSLKYYFDGVLNNTVPSTGTISANTGYKIGKHVSVNCCQLNGSLDEFRIWNRALCQVEIQNNMNAELPAGQTGLVLYHKMNQGFASITNSIETTLTDASGNANNGTLTNFALTGSTSNWVAPGAVVTGSLAAAFVSPTVSIASATTTICSGTSTTYTASGNVSTYAWTSGPTSATYVVSPTVTTTYSVVGTNSLGCVSNMATKTLTVNTTPTVSVNSGSICSGSSFTMVPSGASTYTYSSGSAIVSPTANASYNVTGTSALGCVSSNTAISSVTVNVNPVIAVNSGSIIGGSSFTMTPSGGVSYTFLPSGPIVTPSTSATYTVTGTNSVSCTNTAVSTVSVQGAALNFDGGNDFVSVGSLIPLNSSYTKEAWIYANASGSNNMISSSSSPFWLMGGKLSAVNNGGAVFQDPSAFPLNQWVHVAVTYNASTSFLSLYKNGILVNSGTTTSGYPADAIGIGQYGITGNNYFQGSMDEVKIWNRALCVSEIQNNKNAELSSGQIGLLAYYKMNQGFASISNPTITTLIDASGNSNNGSLTNFALTGTVSNWVAPGAVVTGSLAAAFVSPTVSIASATTTICSGASTTFTASGNVSTYVWTSGSTSATYVVSPTVTTTYSVVGTNSLGCLSNMATKTLTVNATPTVSVTSGSICSGSSFTMVPSGASTYTYSSGSAIVSPTTNTSYNVTGTSALGCVSSNTAVSSVTVNSLPTITVNSGAICVGQSFTMAPGGASTYTYSTGSDVVTPTADATYSVSGTDVNGCISSTDAVSNVTVNSLPTITVNSGAICVGQSFTMTSSGANTYTYSNGSDVATPIVNDSYTVTGTDANGCENTAVASVTVNSLPTVSVSSGAICIGQSFTMTPSGASTYTYSNGSDVTIPTANDSYTVTGTDANGCENTAVASVTVNSLPTVTVNSGAICIGQSFTMTPLGASTYTYSNGSDVTTPIINDSYTVIGADANGCENTAVASVTVNSLPIVSINSGAICIGQSFTMTPGGANTYTYSSGSDVTTPIVNDSYTVTGTDANGCENTAVASVTVNSLPIVSVNSGAICEGQSFTMTPSGADTYTYSNGSLVATPTADATYSVSGTDANGCVSLTDAVSSITVNGLPNLMATTNNTLLCTGETVTLTVSGADTYTWSTTENTMDIAVSPTVQTTYTVNGTDVNSCSNTTTITQDVSVCTGVTSNTSVNATFVNIYPNPNIGLFTIKTDMDMNLNLTNALGQVLQIIQLSDSNNHQMNVEVLSNGIYFVIGQNNYQSVKQKIIVTK